MKITYLAAIALLINSNQALKIRDESDYNLPLLGDDEKERQLTIKIADESKKFQVLAQEDKELIE